MADQLTRPEFTVTYETGDVVTVKASQPDLVGYDVERGRRGWPATSDAPMLWASYVTWCALRRTGQLPDGTRQTFDAWLPTVALVSVEDDRVDPTSADPAPG